MKVSVSVGELAHKHDTDPIYRAKLSNVDPSRTHLNEVLQDTSLEDFYHDRFGSAVEAYNTKQRAVGRPGRCVENYLEKVRGEYAKEREAVLAGKKKRSQKPDVGYEYVIQVGNAEEHPNGDAAKEILREWLEKFEERCPGMEVAWAAVHMDEETPHLHVAVVPVSESSRGLSLKVGWNGALKRCDMKSKVELLDAMKDILRERCRVHDIEVEPDGPGGRAHVPIEEYKRQMDLAVAMEAATDDLSKTYEEVGKKLSKRQADLRSVNSKLVTKRTELDGIEERANRAVERANKACSDAQTAKNAQADAEAAKKTAETARDTAETARDTAEAAKEKAEKDELAAKARLESLKKQVAIVEGTSKWVDPVTKESHLGLAQAKAEVALAEADLTRVTQKVADKEAELKKVEGEVAEKRTTLETLKAAVELAGNQLATIFERLQRQLLSWWREEPWREEHNQEWVDAAVEQERQKWVPEENAR